MIKCFACGVPLIKDLKYPLFMVHPDTLCDLKINNNGKLKSYPVDGIYCPTRLTITQDNKLIEFEFHYGEDILHSWYEVIIKDLNNNNHNDDWYLFDLDKYACSQEVFDKFLLEKITEMKKRIKLAEYEL